MIVGIGVDVVDAARFARTLERTPALAGRLFAPGELVRHPQGGPLPVRSLAVRFAAKEALVKAFGGAGGMGWHDMRVLQDDAGKPAFALSGGAAELAENLGVTGLHLSMSHDGDVAIAYVVAEGESHGR